MRDERIRVLVEVALSVSLAAVLGLLKITLPWNIAGGSVSLTMLPLFVLALRRGVLAGVAAGLLFGFVDYLMEPWFVHPVQVLLDYPIAFAGCGLAGLARGVAVPAAIAGGSAVRALVGSVLGGTARFCASFVSGIVFFSANAAPGQPVWAYSLAYNASYLIPSLIACALAATIIVPTLARAVPVRHLGPEATR